MEGTASAAPERTVAGEPQPSAGGGGSTNFLGDGAVKEMAASVMAHLGGDTGVDHCVDDASQKIKFEIHVAATVIFRRVGTRAHHSQEPRRRLPR